MRLESSIKNLVASMAGQIISVLTTFAVRMVFVRVLSKDYLGIEGLFSSVLTMLSLAELGIGSAIVYSLYEPLAKRDEAKIRSLMRLYQRAYWIIGGVVGVAGTLISFRLEWFLKQVPDIKHLQLYFLCFVANVAVSYFFSYKGSLIAADQKNYVVTNTQYGFNVLMGICQIVILLVWDSYWGFLIVMICSTVLQNITISIISNRLYPFQRKKDVKPLDKKTLSEIKKNTAALMIHSLAGVASTPVTNMILSSYIGLGVVAVYANYLLITNSLQRIITQVFTAATASVGNLGVSESEERKHEVFLTSFYLNAFLAAVFSVPLFVVFKGGMDILFGSGYRFAVIVELVIVILFYTKQIRSAALSFTSAFGLYWFTRYKAIFEAIVLVALSLILVRPFGITGIMVANIVSCVFISAYMEGYMLYKHGFKRSSISYFAKMFFYAVVTFVVGAATYFICSLLPASGVLWVALRGILAVILTIVGFICGTMFTKDFKGFAALVKRSFSLISARFRR